jgi:transcriptional regulator with XRE-family HTH domain
MVYFEALRDAIDESGISLYRLAKDTGVSYTTVWEFYHGKRELSLATLAKFCYRLGVSKLTLTIREGGEMYAEIRKADVKRKKEKGAKTRRRK